MELMIDLPFMAGIFYFFVSFFEIARFTHISRKFNKVVHLLAKFSFIYS